MTNQLIGSGLSGCWSCTHEAKENVVSHVATLSFHGLLSHLHPHPQLQHIVTNGQQEVFLGEFLTLCSRANCVFYSPNPQRANGVNARKRKFGRINKTVLKFKKKKTWVKNLLKIKLQISWGCPRGVVVKVMDCRIVSEFVLQSRYYVHFQVNTLGKGMNPLILPAMG